MIRPILTSIMNDTMKDFGLFLKGNKIFLVHSVLWLLPFAVFVPDLIDYRFIRPVPLSVKITVKGILDTLSSAAFIIFTPMLLLGVHGGFLYFLKHIFQKGKMPNCSICC